MPGCTSWPSLFFCAVVFRRSFFWARVSGRYLCSSLKSCVAGERGREEDISFLPSECEKKNYSSSEAVVIWREEKGEREGALTTSFPFCVQCIIPVCLSRVCVNWLTDGGTFSRWNSTCLCRWSLMYLGHRTKRVRLRFG